MVRKINITCPKERGQENNDADIFHSWGWLPLPPLIYPPKQSVSCPNLSVRVVLPCGRETRSHDMFILSTYFILLLFLFLFWIYVFIGLLVGGIYHIQIDWLSHHLLSFFLVLKFKIQMPLMPTPTYIFSFSTIK